MVRARQKTGPTTPGGENMTQKKSRKPAGTPYKDARGLWTVSIELPNPTGAPGERRRKVIRSKDKHTVVRKAAELRVELAQRGDLITNGIRVERWFARWLDQQAKTVRPKTYESYRTLVNVHIVPALGPTRRLDQLTPRSILAVHERLEKLGRASTTIRNAHHVTAKALEAARREGHITQNPTELVAAPKKQFAKLDVLTLPEAVAMLEHVATLPDGARWATSLLTGARRGEVIGLEVDRVGDVLDLSWQLQRIEGGDSAPAVPPDFEYRRLSGGLYLTRPKSSAGWRIIPLVDPLRTILRHHIETMPENPHGLVFDRNGRGIPRDPDWDSREWRKLMRAVLGDGRNVRLHDLRHTTVDLLYLAGIPEDLIIEIVGHSTRSMSRAYKSRGNQERLLAAMTQLSQLLTTGGDADKTRALPPAPAPSVR